MKKYVVTVTSGSLRPGAATGWNLPHEWTTTGVHVDAEFTGAHLLHVAVAGCVLNDVHREAQALAMPLAGVLVTAEGGFDTTTWTSIGITYDVRVDTDAPGEDLAAVLLRVHELAEIPRALRDGVPVDRAALDVDKPS